MRAVADRYGFAGAAVRALAAGADAICVGGERADEAGGPGAARRHRGRRASRASCPRSASPRPPSGSVSSPRGRLPPAPAGPLDHRAPAARRRRPGRRPPRGTGHHRAGRRGGVAADPCRRTWSSSPRRATSPSARRRRGASARRWASCCPARPRCGYAEPDAARPTRRAGAGRPPAGAGGPRPAPARVDARRGAPGARHPPGRGRGRAGRARAGHRRRCTWPPTAPPGPAGGPPPRS